jgi:hypothetical protein
LSELSGVGIDEVECIVAPIPWGLHLLLLSPEEEAVLEEISVDSSLSILSKCLILVLLIHLDEPFLFTHLTFSLFNFIIYRDARGNCFRAAFNSPISFANERTETDITL